MEKITLYKIAVGGLLILNIVLVAFLWLGRPEGRTPPFRAHERFNLSEEQGETFNESVETHKAVIHQISEEQRNTLSEYFTTLKARTSTTPLPVPEEVLRLEEEKIQSTYDHFLQVKNILQPDQLAEYPAFVDYVITRVVAKTQKSPPPRRSN